MLYTNLGSTEQNHSLLFEDLTPKTEYSFKVRAVNPAGASDWTKATFTTADNPLEFAIDGITAKSTAADQPGFGIWHLFDRAERGDIWHTDYKGGALPFDMTIDLGSFNTLDRMEYLPRLDAGNGTLLQGTVAVSENGIDWSDRDLRRSSAGSLHPSARRQSRRQLRFGSRNLRLQGGRNPELHPR
jgi:hypothetical protein